MSTANDTLVNGTSVQALIDRNDITEVLNRYSSSVDSFDYAGVRSALADDSQAQYANAPAVSSEPGVRTTTALTVSPHFSSGTPMTATPATSTTRALCSSPTGSRT